MNSCLRFVHKAFGHFSYKYEAYFERFCRRVRTRLRGVLAVQGAAACGILKHRLFQQLRSPIDGPCVLHLSLQPGIALRDATKETL